MLLVEMVAPTLAVAVVVVLTTTATLRVATAVQELLSSDTKSELCLNDKLLHGGL
jgi:hypothetical protein